MRAAQIEQTPPTESIEKILEGRVAGVVVSRAPDGGIAVRIRGGTSVHGNNEPLYILDGMPIAVHCGLVSMLANIVERAVRQGVKA